MDNKKFKKYRLIIWLSLLILTVCSIVFIGFYNIPYGKLVFFILYFALILFGLFLDFKKKKYQNEIKSEDS